MPHLLHLVFARLRKNQVIPGQPALPRQEQEKTQHGTQDEHLLQAHDPSMDAGHVFAEPVAHRVPFPDREGNVDQGANLRDRNSHVPEHHAEEKGCVAPVSEQESSICHAVVPRRIRPLRTRVLIMPGAIGQDKAKGQPARSFGRPGEYCMGKDVERL
jgi:hypothetical protein